MLMSRLECLLWHLKHLKRVFKGNPVSLLSYLISAPTEQEDAKITKLPYNDRGATTEAPFITTVVGATEAWASSTSRRKRHLRVLENAKPIINSGEPAQDTEWQITFSDEDVDIVEDAGNDLFT